MRVLVAGNLANMGYEIAKSLRTQNIDASLLMPKFPNSFEDPKNLDPTMNEYPDWIKTFDNHNRKFGLNNWKMQVIKKMKEGYDLIIPLAEFSIFAMFSGIPYAAMTTGSDLRELPLERSIKGFLYKLSYKRARFVIWGEPDKISLVKKLGFEKKSIFATVPRNIEFAPESIKNEKYEGKFIIFHPTAQNWRLKGNDLFLRAFAKFCSLNDNAMLIALKRGEDIDKATSMLDENAKGKFEFLPALNAAEMKYYFNLCNVVADQFKIGSVGMIAVEAMMCGKPVMLKIDEEKFRGCYNDFPDSLTNVSSEQEIFDALVNLGKDPEYCKKLGQDNKRWVEENWNREKLAERYANICKATFHNDISMVGDPSKI